MFLKTLINTFQHKGKMFINRLQSINGQYVTAKSTFKVKYCKDCKHYSKNGQLCKLFQAVDVVTGQEYPLKAEHTRHQSHLCGIGAAHFEVKQSEE